jgi:transketolase
MGKYRRKLEEYSEKQNKALRELQKYLDGVTPEQLKKDRESVKEHATGVYLSEYLERLNNKL